MTYGLTGGISRSRRIRRSSPSGCPTGKPSRTARKRSACDREIRPDRPPADGCAADARVSLRLDENSRASPSCPSKEAWTTCREVLSGRWSRSTNSINCSLLSCCKSLRSIAPWIQRSRLMARGVGNCGWRSCRRSPLSLGSRYSRFPGGAFAGRRKEFAHALRTGRERLTAVEPHDLATASLLTPTLRRPRPDGAFLPIYTSTAFSGQSDTKTTRAPDTPE